MLLTRQPPGIQPFVLIRVHSWLELLILDSIGRMNPARDFFSVNDHLIIFNQLNHSSSNLRTPSSAAAPWFLLYSLCPGRFNPERNSSMMDVSVVPQFAVPTPQAAIAHVNRWLHQQVGTALHAASATFDPVTFYWHVLSELAYGATGPLGQVGDVYVHTATGQFAGHPQAELFQQRAETLAAARGIE
jgi:hypothetical protein